MELATVVDGVLRLYHVANEEVVQYATITLGAPLDPAALARISLDLSGLAAHAANSTNGARPMQATPKRAASNGAAPKRGRAAPGEVREAALDAIRAQPGCRAADVVRVLGERGYRKQTIYSTVNRMVKDGLVVGREGRLYAPETKEPARSEPGRTATGKDTMLEWLSRNGPAHLNAVVEATGYKYATVNATLARYAQRVGDGVYAAPPPTAAGQEP